MDSDTRHRASHPSAWPIIAVYGAVVTGVSAFSYFNHERGDRTSGTSTSVAAADVGAPSHPYSRKSNRSIEPTE